MNAYQRALALKEETAAHRRWLHAHAETGLCMPQALDYIKKALTAAGLQPRPCGHGLMAELGQGGKTLLLRADMDALPMPEQSGEPFACPTGREAHACGHDMHAAMLLTAAKLLKEDEAQLHGRVRLMFQPAEETFEGARDMIAHGILDGVDAALAYHVAAGKMPVGLFMYNDTGAMMHSVDTFRITIAGRGAHGAYPHQAVDPIHIGAHLCLALEGLIAREADPAKSCVLTIGSFSAGAAANIIPDRAVLQGTIRTNDPGSRALLVRRMQELSASVAAACGGKATIELLSGAPPLLCDGGLTREMVGYMQELDIPGLAAQPGISSSASEDFAAIAERVPGAFIYLSAGYPDARGEAPAHNPKVRFNEAVLPIGAGCLAHCAVRFLQAHDTAQEA